MSRKFKIEKLNSYKNELIKNKTIIFKDNDIFMMHGILGFILSKYGIVRGMRGWHKLVQCEDWDQFKQQIYELNNTKGGDYFE